MSVSFLLYVPLLLGLVAAYRCLRATRVMFCRICNPTAKNIRIFDPRLIPINQKIGSNRIENPYIIFRQIANQPAH